MVKQVQKGLKTHLISGAGNTFHIHFTELKVSENLKEITKKICSEQPADGTIFLRWKDKARDQLIWDFFNNDGSDAEMCGNATRCVGFYVKKILKEPTTKWHLETVAGQIEIQYYKENQYKVIMTPIIEKKSNLGFFCDTGVPHLILPIDDFTDYKTKKEMAREFRFHKEFAPTGTNVTFVQMLPETDKINAVSYERGVEDFTFACGTGAAAAAFYNFKTRHCSLTEVSMPGGKLTFDLTNLQKPIMIGPAELKGEFTFKV